MDAIDHDILRSLQENGRMTNLELAKAVGLSPTILWKRARNVTADSKPEWAASRSMGVRVVSSSS